MATAQPPIAPRPWLVLGAETLAVALASIVPDIEIRSVTTAAFAEELAADRQGVVILATPPAELAHLNAVSVLRRRSRTTLRTVLLTAQDDLAARLAALEHGFDDALPNTIDPRELAARVRRLTAPSRTPGVASAIPIADGVELDLRAYALRRAGQPERLRPKEFQLLALLATHPRRAFTRAELLERIWGPGFTGDPRTIDVHLRWLRAKVEAAPENPRHLVTVRGRGYRFDPPP